MATDIRVLNSAPGTDAAFQAWASGIAAQLAAIGLIRTADTGQITVASATKPTVALTSAGYEIYRFDDTLQATAPVFIKVEYGTGANAAVASLWVTVGTGTNGAGTLTGQVGSRRQIAFAVTGAATYYASGSQAGTPGGRVNLFLNYTPGNANWGALLWIERPKDGDGSAQADGIAFGILNVNTASFWFQTIPMTGAIPAGTGTAAQVPTMAGGPGGAASASIVGLNVALVPFFCVVGRFLFTSILAYSSNDIGDAATISVTYLGAAHNYRTFKDPPISGAGFTFSIALLWE